MKIRLNEFEKEKIGELVNYSYKFKTFEICVEPLLFGNYAVAIYDKNQQLVLPKKQIEVKEGNFGILFAMLKIEKIVNRWFKQFNY